MSEKQIRRISRGRKLTPEEAAKYRKLREQIEEEIPPKRKSPAIKQIVEALRTAREQAGLSLADIHERTGMERSAISRIENEAPNLTVQTLERYAQALGQRIVIRLEPDDD